MMVSADPQSEVGNPLAGEGRQSFALPHEVRRAWTPRERLSVSRWADKYRVLQAEYSAEPGQYRTRRTPYLAEVMDAFVDPRVRFINLVKSARVGGSEAGNNMLGFAVDQEPGPMLYVYPIENDVKEEFRDRLAKFIQGSPRLAEHIPAAGWDSRTELQLDTCMIYGAWATSQNTMLRRTCRYVFIDELDNCDNQTGRLGETLALVLKRLVTFRDRAKGVAVTTPSTSEASSWQMWQDSDQRKYHVPCPKCGQYQELVFDRIRVEEGERDHKKILREDSAWYQCSGCEGRLTWRKHQRWMVLRGVWLKEGQTITEPLPVDDSEIAARAVFDQPDRWLPTIEGDPPSNRVAGFHIWAAYSPWVSWSEIIAEWFAVLTDREKRIVFRNQVLGQPWEDVAVKASTSLLREQIAQGLPKGQVPAAVKAITCGVDVQKDRVYYVVRGWGDVCESWLVDHGVIFVTGKDGTVLTALQAFYERVIMSKPYGGHAPGVTLIDSGYRTRDVYAFCQLHPGCYACKGEDSTQSHLVRKGKMEPKRGRKAINSPKRTLWLVNTNVCKDTLYAWAGMRGEGPQVMHLHAETDNDYCRQFTAEIKVYDTRKRREVWKLKAAKADNHYLDCEQYGLAAAELSNALSFVPGAAKLKRRQRKPAASAREFLGLSR